MKKIALFLFAIMAMTVCFTSCNKEETEDPEATLSDFYGKYDVTIYSKGIGLTPAVDTFSATLTIKGVDAKLLDVTLFQSQYIAQLKFATSEPELKVQDFYPVLDSVFGTAKDGYMTLLCTNTLQGNTILFKGNTVAYKSNSLSWVGYYGKKTDNWLTSLTSYKTLTFNAVRRDN